MTKFSAPQQNQLAQIGAFLRDNREKQSKSLEDIAICTYIRPQLLSGIETGNPDMLPEPIFVQGFIRRYGEALGLNGIELSQQFIVTSIPSTPRPAPPAPPEDSPTTRLTRLSPTQQRPASQPPATAPMFSAGDSMAAPVPYAEPNFNSVPEPAAIPAPVPAPVEIRNDLGNDLDSLFDTTVNGLEPANSSMAQDSMAQDLDSSFDPEVKSRSVAEDDDFASRIAAFDQANLNQASLGSPLVESSLESSAESPAESIAFADSAPLNSVSLENTQNSVLTSDQSTPRFDDDLPTAFTTEGDPFKPQTNLAGVEYDRADQPNLKPFIIGGVIAAIATGAILLANMLGGNRQPSVANSSQTTEQVAPEAQVAPPTVAPTPTAAPPASSAPVYVEAKATAEAWVSVIADGNPNPIFEDTLKPGETKLWEAQKNISIYSGDAGALTLAPNGGEPEVMGERGQPQEKLFPQ